MTVSITNQAPKRPSLSPLEQLVDDYVVKLVPFFDLARNQFKAINSTDLDELEFLVAGLSAIHHEFAHKAYGIYGEEAEQALVKIPNTEQSKSAETSMGSQAETAPLVDLADEISKDAAAIDSLMAVIGFGKWKMTGEDFEGMYVASLFRAIEGFVQTVDDKLKSLWGPVKGN